VTVLWLQTGRYSLRFFEQYEWKKESGVKVYFILKNEGFFLQKSTWNIQWGMLERK